MIKTQSQLFEDENGSLAPYAIRSSQSRGRKHKEAKDPYRTPFQRDRDRIMHSKAFRRLGGKTQVFVSQQGDHFRSRLTHSIEVSQVARGIARALGLNEDLCESIALAHDLGHTPFGHAGEEAMSDMMIRFDDVFEHNEQSRRVVMHLETKSPDYPGLNLSFETIEGMMKHRSKHDDGKTPVIHSLEAQVVDLADAIAYHHHDLDDGLRSGILHYESLHESVELWQMATDELSLTELGEDLYRHIAINRVISILINDVIEYSDAKIQDQQLLTPLQEPRSVIQYSQKVQERADQLADFLGQHFYLNERITSEAVKGQKVIKYLFQLYSEKDELLPQSVRALFLLEKRHIVIKDYIAGMTDAFAKHRFEEYKDLL
jgi:dGTPase